MEILPTTAVSPGIEPAMAALLLESPPGMARNVKTIMRAVVTGTATGNVLLLLSAEGNIAVRTATPIAVGSVVVLEVDVSHGRVAILSVQPNQSKGVLPEPATAQVIESAPALAARRGVMQAVATAQSPDGISHLETPEGKIAVRTAVPVPSGSVVLLDLDSGHHQAQILSVQPPPLQGRTVPEQGRAAPLPGRTAPEPPRAAIVIDRPPALAGRVVSATVTAQGPNETIVLKAAEGVIVIRSAAAAPTGSTVTLELDGVDGRARILSVQPAAQLNAATTAGGTLPAVVPERLLFGWPALSDALATLARNDPLRAAIVIDDALARPGRRLADAILRWTEALGASDGTAAFGTGVWAMLRDALADDLAAIRTLTTPNPEGWRAFPIPLHDGRALGVLGLMVRGEPPRAEGAAPQRIVIQFPLHNLGEIRIEALARYRHLEVLVRCTTELPDPVIAEIGAIFTGAKEAFGYGGALNFRVGPLPLIILGPAQTPVHDVTTA